MERVCSFSLNGRASGAQPVPTPLCAAVRVDGDDRHGPGRAGAVQAYTGLLCAFCRCSFEYTLSPRLIMYASRTTFVP